MPRPEWRDPSKEKRWRRLLKQWRRSGLTGRDFCAAPLPAFMPVTLEAAASAETALEVVLLHGRVLRVRPGFDADELRRLLTVLEAPSC